MARDHYLYAVTTLSQAGHPQQRLAAQAPLTVELRNHQLRQRGSEAAAFEHAAAHVGTAAQYWIRQRDDVLGAKADEIRVEKHHELVLDMPCARCQRTTLATVDCESHDLGAGVSSHCCRGVAGTIVDDDHGPQSAGNGCPDDSSDGQLFVESRDEDGDGW